MLQLNQFEVRLLGDIRERRRIGKRGLPVYLVRDEPVKVRFTASDRATVIAVSKAVGTTEAQFLYTLVISSIRNMMQKNPLIAQTIRMELIRGGKILPDWMKEL